MSLFPCLQQFVMLSRTTAFMTISLSPSLQPVLLGYTTRITHPWWNCTATLASQHRAMFTHSIGNCFTLISNCYPIVEATCIALMKQQQWQRFSTAPKPFSFFKALQLAPTLNPLPVPQHQLPCSREQQLQSLFICFCKISMQPALLSHPAF